MKKDEATPAVLVGALTTWGAVALATALTVGAEGSHIELVVLAFLDFSFLYKLSPIYELELCSAVLPQGPNGIVTLHLDLDQGLFFFLCVISDWLLPSVVYFSLFDKFIN